MAMDKVDGTFCPACMDDYAPDRSNIRVLGRPYLYKNKLNVVIKCIGCGNVHSWKEELLTNITV